MPPTMLVLGRFFPWKLKRCILCCFLHGRWPPPGTHVAAAVGSTDRRQNHCQQPPPSSPRPWPMGHEGAGRRSVLAVA
ncbi:hypothetical protein GUJ93_ZPchr0009g1124 [Zizania palustris]|uniref:Uncharacterized protein n=1 Tax=Zizania palustris TaxID=103762 RepID=A0A8J5S650_ZIZPA|nr:hypothetical protein GUJ93_ZPchr0009g1124 [Zizania palustris]